MLRQQVSVKHLNAQTRSLKAHNVHYRPKWHLERASVDNIAGMICKVRSQEILNISIVFLSIKTANIVMRQMGQTKPARLRQLRVD
jgi:hypothetical protein